MPLSIHPLFWLFAALIGWLNSSSFIGTLIWIVIIFVSILVHELGHAITAKGFRQNVHITITFFGGVTTRSGPKVKPWQEFIIILNGPIAGFLLSAVAAAARSSLSPEVKILYPALTITIIVNIFWSIVNLLPVLPLDGGHLMRVIMEAIFKHRGTKIAAMISFCVAIVLSFIAVTTGYIIAAMLFSFFCFESFRMWQTVRHMSHQDRNETHQETLSKAKKLVEEGRLEEAATLFLHIRAETKKGLIFSTATEQLAQIYLTHNRKKEAYEILAPIEQTLSIDSLIILQQLACEQQNFPLAAKVGNHLYSLYPTAEVAFYNAISLAALIEEKPAVGWLECAQREGMDITKQTTQDPRFQPIQHGNLFKKFQESLDN
ncbi:site-2 protease family protein [Simkania negevensis]|uniref:Site-2 protease family protein n=1 Tax=Simkania negevensis TaxID=83561 RepID=A0ABS3AR93_9BACT|nr:site-2 protease family protein [Simkania negevensis]